MESLNDMRIVELQWEEVFGKLQQLRREARDGQRSALAHTRELLAISETLREMSQRTRIRSQTYRNAKR